MSVPVFDRAFFRSPQSFTRIGDGSLGGKAGGLLELRHLLAGGLSTPSEIEVHVPRLVVLATGVFDRFVQENSLEPLLARARTDEHVGQAFLRAELPVEIVGDLRALVEETRTPLAIRSSSLLEDALFRPFAGVYETKMVPNNLPDADGRFRRLVEAIKFVYASTYFSAAADYRRATGLEDGGEKMAVIIQEVVGLRHDERFYPHLSGVARSYNFFPAAGVSPRDGVVNLALGLGKTIVDGGTSWLFSPARPKAPPPFSTTREMLHGTQLDFWAIHMGAPPAYNPFEETEHLVRVGLDRADYDGTLARLVSTYDPGRDRLVPGMSARGPRVVDFAPLLADSALRFNDLVREILQLGETALGRAAEIEFAATLPHREESRTRLALLQLRPMLVSEDEIDVRDDELGSPDVLLVSEKAVGNGAPTGIRDIVYVRPDAFEAASTPRIAEELAEQNRRLVDEHRPYLLIGFGRWGSSDPWLGIPVRWSQVGGARVIVESTLPGMDVEASQGAHFFHNLIGLQVPYLCVHHGDRGIDWRWLEGQPSVAETRFVRRLRLSTPLTVKVDGRSGRGAVWHP